MASAGTIDTSYGPQLPPGWQGNSTATSQPNNWFSQLATFADTATDRFFKTAAQWRMFEAENDGPEPAVIYQAPPANNGNLAVVGVLAGLALVAVLVLKK